jgi:prepilin-type processing-associated H-X9-DG protein
MNDNDLQINSRTADQQVEQNGGLDDLRLTDEELDGIKGGCGPFHKDDPPPSFTIWLNNHNETMVGDEDLVLLADLEPNFDVIGGSSGGAAGGIVSEGQGYGVFIAATASTSKPGSYHSSGINVCLGDGSVR